MIKMSQMNLFGVDAEVAIEQSKDDAETEAQKEFFRKQITELTEIREMIVADDLPLEYDDGTMTFDLKKVLGAWWYCNHIVGWDNNVPYFDKSKEFSPMDYDDVPNCDLMSDCIRSCFIAVERDGVKWDKEYALRRLNKAIEEYTEDLQ
jgi:hypothetical protein